MLRYTSSYRGTWIEKCAKQKSTLRFYNIVRRSYAWNFRKRTATLMVLGNYCTVKQQNNKIIKQQNSIAAKQQNSKNSKTANSKGCDLPLGNRCRTTERV